MCPPPPINLWQYSTLHLHLHTHSKPGCTATFGHAHPSMFPIAWRTFHHKPALVAPIILWLEYFLCAHHTNFPKFQLLGTHVDPLKTGRKPREGILCSLPCLVPRVRAMSEAQPKGSSNLSSRCAMNVLMKRSGSLALATP